jgi:hypothetical protein
MGEQELVATRRSLHGVAELVIAGPQYRSAGSIELRVRPGGFGGAVAPVRVEGAELVFDGGRVPLGGTCRSLAEAAGLAVSGLDDVYKEGSGVGPDDPLTLDPAALEELLGWFGRGEAALRAFAPGEEPILWPEHFDVGYALDEVNYGISPGDAGSATPYAYVGPWSARTGAFWNAPFGAARGEAELPDVDAVVAFFAEGRAAAAG